MDVRYHSLHDVSRFCEKYAVPYKSRAKVFASLVERFLAKCYISGNFPFSKFYFPTGFALYPCLSFATNLNGNIAIEKNHILQSSTRLRRNIKPCFHVQDFSKSKFALFTVFRRRFRGKSRHLQWLVFFRQFKAICPLFCSFVHHHQLELRTSKAYSKRQNLVHNKNIDVQNIDNIGPPPRFFTGIFFGTM